MRSFDDRPAPEEPRALKVRLSSRQDLRVTAKDLIHLGYTEFGCPRFGLMQTHGSSVQIVITRIAPHVGIASSGSSRHLKSPKRVENVAKRKHTAMDSDMEAPTAVESCTLDAGCDPYHHSPSYSDFAEERSSRPIENNDDQPSESPQEQRDARMTTRRSNDMILGTFPHPAPVAEGAIWRCVIHQCHCLDKCLAAVSELHIINEEEVEELTKEPCIVSALMGDKHKAFQTRSRKLLHTSVSEIHSPTRSVRAATMLPRLGIEAGMALDLMTGDEQGPPWEVNDPAQHGRATVLLDQLQLNQLVGGPECRLLSP